jgi:vancomycin resistance protein YoaR
MSRTAIIGASVGAVVAVLVAAVAGVALSRGGEALPGVTVDGIDVAGLGPDDLRATLAPVAESRATVPVVVRHDGREFEVDPEALGVALDIDTLVDRALAAGRDGSGLARLLAKLRGVDGLEVAAPAEVDADDVRRAVVVIADEVDTAIEDGSVGVDPASLEVEVVLPADGLETDVDATTEVVAAALRDGGPSAVDLVATTLPAVVDPADVETLAGVAERAVAAPLVLRGGGDEVELAPRDVALLLSSRRRGPDSDATLELAVTTTAVREVLGGRVDALLTAPVDARYVTPSTPPTRLDDQDDASWRPVRDVGVSVVAGVTGSTFDPELAAAQLEVVLADGVREVDLRLAELEPTLTTAAARAHGVDDLLSTFTTYHACCATRVTNIQRLADTVDDTIVLPGEQFSVNQLSGVRTCEDGYAAAGMILDGEIVDVCGGGVSQFGTTTVNAVFFAGLDPDAYKPHSFYISRYPMAREATLNYPSPDIDVRFTNDTGAPIVVRASYTGTSITVSLYGNAGALSEVRADLGSTYNDRDYPTRRRQNLELPAGVTRTVQNGANGFRVNLTRTIVRPAGTTTDDWSNTYSPIIEVVEFNPNRPPPPPAPAPAPTQPSTED